MAFRLLQSIFSGASQPGKFDKELMLRGIERVVDGTDPRLRAVSHYRRKLWAPVERAIDFVVNFVNALPPAIGWTAAGGSLGDPAMAALCFAFFVWQVPHFWLLSLLHAEGYEQAGFPTLTRHFDRAQILRLTFTWTCGTLAAGALLPLFHALRGLPALVLLGVASLWLLVRFTRLLRPTLEASTIRRAFLEINIYALALMAAVIWGALGAVG